MTRIALCLVPALLLGCSGSFDDDAGGTIGLSCEEIAEEANGLLEELRACRPDETCAHAFIGSGCSDSVLPACGFPHVKGADTTRLEELDDAYRADECAGEPVACVECKVPTAVECVAGRCESSY